LLHGDNIAKAGLKACSLQFMLTKPELIKIPENELTMLKDVLRVNVLYGVVRGMNVWVAVFKRSLEHKRSRKTITGCRAVIGTSVSTLAFYVGNVGVLCLC
jgi:hypothetical protein